jgi:hypothetical protein
VHQHQRENQQFKMLCVHVEVHTGLMFHSSGAHAARSESTYVGSMHVAATLRGSGICTGYLLQRSSDRAQF